jgi:hypothetical protein
MTLGKCTAPSGLTKFYAQRDWVIWVAADHIRDRQFDDRMVEALVFHELLHCGLTESEEPEDVKPTTVGHDIEAFFKEVEVYGLWKTDIAQAAVVLGKQLRLGEEAPVEPLTVAQVRDLENVDPSRVADALAAAIPDGVDSIPVTACQYPTGNSHLSNIYPTS